MIAQSLAGQQTVHLQHNDLLVFGWVALHMLGLGKAWRAVEGGPTVLTGKQLG